LLAPPFDRAQQKHASRNRPSGTVSSDFSPAQDESTTRNTEARTAGTDRTRVREDISASGMITTVESDAIDDRSPGVKQRRRTARWSRIAFSVRLKLQHP
jgi:hypothetical protein